MKLSKDLREFIALLNSKKVKYIIMGGYAVAYHGHPRFTGDIDFLVERSETNAKLLEEVLNEFGFSGIGVTAKDFLEPNVMIQLGRPPNRIDLMTGADGVEFQEAWDTKENSVMDDQPVFFISKKLLIQNKKAVNRPQDLADIEKLTGSS